MQTKACRKCQELPTAISFKDDTGKNCKACDVRDTMKQDLKNASKVVCVVYIFSSEMPGKFT